MDINKNLNVKVIAPIAVVGVLAVGYFAMSSYASSKAEQQLTDYMYDNQLEDSISWKSVSSSPLGGTVTLKKVRIENDDVFPVELIAERVVIKDYQQTNKVNSMNVQFYQVAPIDDESDFSEFYYQDLFGSVSALSEQGKVAPYDLNIYWNYNIDKQQARVGFAMDIPNAGKGEFAAEFNEVMHLASLYQLSYLHPSFRILPNLPIESSASMRDLERIELVSLAMGYEDKSYLARLNALEQRYNLPISPLKGDAKQQRQQAVTEDYRSQLRSCEEDFLPVYKQAKKACQAVLGTWYAQEKGLRFTLSPDKPLRLGELGRLDGGERAVKGLIERANPSFTVL